MQCKPNVDVTAKAVKSSAPEDRHSTPVTIGKLAETKTTGVKTRGNGAATKGVTARGPMA